MTKYERQSWTRLVFSYKDVTTDDNRQWWCIPKLTSLSWEWVRDANGTRWFTNDPYGGWWITADKSDKLDWRSLMFQYGPITTLREKQWR